MICYQRHLVSLANVPRGITVMSLFASLPHWLNHVHVYSKRNVCRISSTWRTFGSNNTGDFVRTLESENHVDSGVDSTSTSVVMLCSLPTQSLVFFFTFIFVKGEIKLVTREVQSSQSDISCELCALKYRGLFEFAFRDWCVIYRGLRYFTNDKLLYALLIHFEWVIVSSRIMYPWLLDVNE